MCRATPGPPIKEGVTRRDLILRGSLALAATSPLLTRLLDMPAHAAVPRTAWSLGAFVNPGNDRLTFAASQREIARFESLLARPLDLVSTFVAWDERFPNEGHALDRDAGRTPLIAWDGRRDLAAISAGRWDRLLKEHARRCREFGAPIYLRWAAEFNGPWNPCHGRPRQFARAWRHVVRTFRDAGATNVRWVWCPFATPAVADVHTYYPGDRYVDWIGIDGYNWGRARSWSRWQSFRQIFAPLYAAYARRKPLLLCEIASAEVGGDKAAWIRDMGVQLAGPFSKIRAVVWFHANKETDWRVDSSRASLEAFRAVLAHN
jgi:hypothetical protein